MSTIIGTEPVQPAGALEWVPSPLYRITLAKYEAMIASGAFTKRDRISLINGYLVSKMTELPPHGAACDAIHSNLEPLLPSGWFIRSERAIRIPSFDSMPEPDVAVTRGTWRDYANRYAEPSDIAMIVDVANSSIREDRAMASIYGAVGIPAYWIVNLIDRQVEVYSDPGETRYKERRVFPPETRIPVVIGAQNIGAIDVENLLP